MNQGRPKAAVKDALRGVLLFFRSFVRSIKEFMKTKKTVVVGASPDANRYSYRAVTALRRQGYDVTAVGLKPGTIGDIPIHTDLIPVDQVDTVTLYVHPRNQQHWMDYILTLNPRRVVFNPGTENPEFFKKLRAEGIDAEESCTLVMLSVGTY